MLERQIALAGRLPDVISGKDKPATLAECLDFAQLCYDRKFYAASARLWAEAFAKDPKVVADRARQHRYNAACAAALAGCGQGKDEPPPDDVAKSALRKQALEWLKAEHAEWAKFLETGPPQAHPFVAQTLRHWKADTDLAGIRDELELAKLPESERQGWQALWAEVAELLKKAETP